MLGRSQAKADDALALLKDLGGSVSFIALDLEDLASVRLGAEELASSFDYLDILFCNAGVMAPPASAVTKHGHDLQVTKPTPSRLSL
jgi:NAD(P)-dependent dehydrogenase (short-subunit alcohol dehydrogenase family)